MRDLGLCVVAAVTLAGIALVVSAGSAGAHSKSGTTIDVEKTISGNDTYAFTLNATKAFKIKNKSSLAVKANFGSGGPIHSNVQVIGCCGPPTFSRGAGWTQTIGPDNPQDAGALFGILREGKDCNRCFFHMIGDSLKDVDDARVAFDTLDVSYDRDPNRAAYDTFQTTLQWPTDDWFRGPGDQDTVSYNVFISIPGANEIVVDVHMHINKGPIPEEGNGNGSEPATWRDTSNDGGFLRVTEDFHSTAEAETVAGEAMVDGETTYTYQPALTGDRLYAYMSPAWWGNPMEPTATFTTAPNTVSYGFYGVEFPNGQSTSREWIGFAGPAGPRLVGLDDPGDYRFFVHYQAGLGPTDMYVVGFQGDPNG